MKKFQFKKLVLINIVLGSLTSLSAYGLAPTQGWFVELEGFYARPSDSLLNGLPYAFTDVDVTTLSPALQDFHHIHFGGDWAGRIGIGYDYFSDHSTCATTGFSLEYTWFNNTNNEHLFSIAGPGEPEIDDNSTLSGIFFDVIPPEYSNADLKLDVNYDVVDLLGHKKNNYCNMLWDFFAGIRFARISEDLLAHYYVDPNIGVPPTEFAEETISYKVNLYAIGPQIGAKLFYSFLCSGLGVTGQLSGSLLFAKSDMNYNDHFFDPDSEVYGGPKEITFRNKGDDLYHIVPNVFGKVALAYNHSWVRGCKCYSVSIEAGIHGDRYFGAIDHNALIQCAGAHEDIKDAARSRMYTEDTRYHNLDMVGPYMSLTFHS